MSKKIVIINGSGGVGKDAFVEFCGEFTCVKNISSVDKVKEAAKVLVNWDGTKDDKSRKLLVDLKRLSIEYMTILQSILKNKQTSSKQMMNNN